jgi:hypothetical protein
MSENTLNTQITGTTIEAAHLNQYKTALVEDLLPRNLAGQNEDEAGSLGSDLFRWLKGIFSTLFTNKLSIGSSGNEATNPYIINDTDSFKMNVITGESHGFYVNNVLKGKIDVNGVDGAYFKALSISAGVLNTNSVAEGNIINSSVTVNKLGADCVNGTKIADDAVDTEHIADAAIGPVHMSNRPQTSSNITDIQTLQFADSSTVTPTATNFANGVNVTVTVTKAGGSVVAWYVTSSNANHRCGITGQSDEATTAGVSSGLIISASDITITARVYNTAGTSQAGTVTLRAYVLN